MNDRSPGDTVSSGHPAPDHEKKRYPVVVDNLWTSAQRKSNSIHEISYRACFKAQLPAFFIRNHTNPGDTVYDPFMGRGTTPIEAALNKRRPMGVDINPLSLILTLPRLDIPSIGEIEGRLSEIPMENGLEGELDLSMFFHGKTEGEILGLRSYLASRKEQGEEDNIDRFIRMVATNRLTGHSSGFFSVYTLPPNQAATRESQVRINRKRSQEPTYRDVKKLILKKAASLLRDIDERTRNILRSQSRIGMFNVMDARNTSSFIEDGSVNLTVTSPPFLNIVQYETDNWLRLWFNDIKIENREEAPFVTSQVKQWKSFIDEVFKDLFRVTRPGGKVAFEVGEVRNGKINLEDYVLDSGTEAGLQVEGIYINTQKFTKTSHIWGVRNNRDGTNTNRIVLFKKDS